MSNKTNISIHCTLTDAEPDLIFAELNNRFKELLQRAGRYEKALKQIEQMSDPGNYWKAICDMKAIATEALNCKSNDNGTTENNNR